MKHNIKKEKRKLYIADVFKKLNSKNQSRVENLTEQLAQLHSNSPENKKEHAKKQR